MLGHSGYLETCRRALIYCLRLHRVQFTYDEVEQFMEVYQGLQPYPDAVEGLAKLSTSIHLVALSNGEQGYLEHLVQNNICVEFWRSFRWNRPECLNRTRQCTALLLRFWGREPAEIMMVAAHSFRHYGCSSLRFQGCLRKSLRAADGGNALPTRHGSRRLLELAAHLVS